MTQTLTEPARKDLLRSVPFTLTRDAGARGDGLTLDGYAAVFDTPTTICSWEGTFTEQVKRGAFKKSLSERTPVLQFDHGSHPFFGSIPLGNIEQANEDKSGLHVIARLDDGWFTEPVRNAIASGAVSGMSFRFEVVRDEWRDQKGELVTDPEELWRRIYGGDESNPATMLSRTLVELKCRELGPVVFPAYEETSVGVRSKVTIDLGRLGDPDQRRELARMVWMADRAGAPEGTEQAADHAGTTDAPQATDQSAGEHESPIYAEPAGLRSAIDYWLKRNERAVENAVKRGT